MMGTNFARVAGTVLVAVLFSALPTKAEISSVGFKTSRNVSFY